MSTRSRNPRHARRRDRSIVFAALGDRTRLALVAQLCDGEATSIAQLTKGSHLTRQAITKHLRVLEHAGLVRCTHHGRESLFALETAPLLDAQNYLHSVSEQWDNALARLKAFVEN